jgi:hypothetical protein
VTRELEPGFNGLSFQVIRRNARSYALYREAADAFSLPVRDDKRRVRQRRTARANGRAPRSSYDPLQGLNKRNLVRRIRAAEAELASERHLRAALAYDQQTLLGIRLETEIVVMKAEHTYPE